MWTLNKREKTIRSPGVIFNYTDYKEDDSSYIFFYRGLYIGFVDMDKVGEIIE